MSESEYAIALLRLMQEAREFAALLQPGDVWL